MQSRDSGQCRLDAESDLLFDLHRRQRGRCCIDLHLLVGDVGHCIDRKTRERPSAQCDEAETQHDNNPAMLNGKIENALDHDYCLMCVSSFAAAEIGLQDEGVGSCDPVTGRQAGDHFD